MLNRWQKNIVDRNGNIVPYAQVMIMKEEDQSLATVFRDRNGLDPYPMGQVTADEYGFVYFYAEADLYRIRSAQPAIDWRDVDIGSANALSNVITAEGDLVVGDEGGLAARLPKGDPNTVLGVDESGNLGYKPDPTPSGSDLVGGGNDKIFLQVQNKMTADFTMSAANGNYLIVGPLDTDEFTLDTGDAFVSLV